MRPARWFRRLAETELDSRFHPQIRSSRFTEIHRRELRFWESAQSVDAVTTHRGELFDRSPGNHRAAG